MRFTPTECLAWCRQVACVSVLYICISWSNHLRDCRLTKSFFRSARWKVEYLSDFCFWFNKLGHKLVQQLVVIVGVNYLLEAEWLWNFPVSNFQHILLLNFKLFPVCICMYTWYFMPHESVTKVSTVHIYYLGSCGLADASVELRTCKITLLECLDSHREIKSVLVMYSETTRVSFRIFFSFNSASLLSIYG